MVTKKRDSKTVARKKKSAARQKHVRRTHTKRGKKAARKKAAPKKTVRKKTVRKKARATRRVRGGANFNLAPPLETRGLGPEAGGQSGDTEGLSRAELADSESVEELVEEGQAFDAGVISGVENAPEAGKRGVRTRQVPEDDVPQEYLDED
jgi:hypothetical protein